MHYTLAHTFQHYMLGLFAVANNFSALGLFLSVCGGVPKDEQRKLVNIATLTAFITMIVAFFIGDGVLRFFGISLGAFQIAGGLLLCTSGIGMLNAKSPSKENAVQEEDFSSVISEAVVPIGIPLTTGAGTISTIIIYSADAATWMGRIPLLAAIFVMTVIIYLIFRYSTRLFKVLGATGMNVLIKVMGLITLALGIQFIVVGISKVFPSLMQ